MATLQEAAVAAPPQRPPEKESGGRLVSLDAYRGFIMLLLVSEGFGLAVLKSRPAWAWLAAQVDHAAWEGCTFLGPDPAGVHLAWSAWRCHSPFARRAQGGGTWGVFRHVAWRAFMLVLLRQHLLELGLDPGAAIPAHQRAVPESPSATCLCYWITRMHSATRWPQPWRCWPATGRCSRSFPGPEGAWSKTAHIGSGIDLKVLGYNYSGYYTTINFIGNAVTFLFGCGRACCCAPPSRTHTSSQGADGVRGGELRRGLALNRFHPMVSGCDRLFHVLQRRMVILMLAVFYC